MAGSIRVFQLALVDVRQYVAVHEFQLVQFVEWRTLVTHMDDPLQLKRER